MGTSFDALSGAEVNISSGTVGSSIEALSGSEVNISGGSVNRLIANSGSAVDFSGGFVSLFTADTGSQVSISGGTVGYSFAATPGSAVELFGGEFRLNGDVFTGQSITLGEDEVFTGTLADGSSFVFSSQRTYVF